METKETKQNGVQMMADIVLTQYMERLSSFREYQTDALKRMLNLWVQSGEPMSIDIEEGDFRCSVQQFASVEQVDIVRIELRKVDIDYGLFLVTDNGNTCELMDVVDDGATAHVIEIIARHITGAEQ